MYLTRHRTAGPGEGGISFPKLECWNPVTEVATVAAQVNQKRVLCRISMEVLREKFCARADEPMRAVAEHRIAIQNAARKLIENEAYEEDGSILIRARDL